MAGSTSMPSGSASRPGRLISGAGRIGRPAEGHRRLAGRALLAAVATILAGASGGLLPVVASAGAASSAVSPLAKVGPAAALPAHTKVLGQAPSNKRLQIAVGLAPTNAAGLTELTADVSDPGSVQQGRYLAKGQFAQLFGAPDTEITAVKSSLKASGLTVTGTSADHLLVDASGSVGQIEAAFHTSIDDVTLRGGRTAFANTSAPELPTTLAKDVVGVTGLSDVARSVPHYKLAGHAAAAGGGGTGAASPGAATPSLAPPSTIPSQSTTGGVSECAAETLQIHKLAMTKTLSPLAWTAVAVAYGYNQAYHAGDFGQTVSIGVFELSPYTSADLAAFDQCSLLTYTGTIGTVTNVPVDGGAGAGAGTIEPILDVEDLQALAPAADLVVYAAPNSTVGSLDAYDAMVATDGVQVISTSWGQCEPLVNPEAEAIEHFIFEEAAVQGQTVFSASGDTGSTDCRFHTTTATPTTTFPLTVTTTTQIAVDDPASDPYVTGVGGTTLAATTVSLHATFNQTAWGTPTRKIGGGGGVSARFAKPAWQTTGRSSIPAPATASGECSVSATPTLTANTPTPTATPTTFSTACRQVPDVVANANPTVGGVMIYCKGQGTYCTTKTTSLTGWEVVGGTSEAAPEWAALAALADEQCGEPVGFINPRLYALRTSGDLTNVDTGTNDVTGVHPGQYTAAIGYNNATGLGSADVGALTVDGGLCPTEVSATTTTTLTVTPTVAGASAQYTLHFTTSATGPLVSGDTITLEGPAGTTFPADPFAYTVNGQTPTLVSPNFTGLSPSFNTVVITLAATIGAGSLVSLAVGGVINTGTAGPQRLTVATSTDAGVVSYTFPITAGPVTPTTSTVVATPPSVLADGATALLTVSARDAFGNPVPHAVIRVTPSSGFSTSTTDSNTTGLLQLSYSSTTPTAVTFTVSTPLTVTGTTAFVPIGAPATIDFSEISPLTVTQATRQAGTTETSVTLAGSGPSMASGSTFTVTAPAGTTLPASAGRYGLHAPGTVTLRTVVVSKGPGSSTDNVASFAVNAATTTGTFQLTIDTVKNPTAAGSAVITLATTTDPVPGAGTFKVTAGAVDPTTSTVVPAYPSAPSDGLSADLVTVTAEDRYGNPVGTQTIRVALTGQAQATPSTSVTDATGQFLFGVTDPTAQLVTVTVTTPDGTLAPLTLSFTGISPLVYDVVTSLTTFAPDSTTGDATSIEAFAELSGGVKPGGWLTLTTLPGTQLPTTGGDYGVLNQFSKFQTATVSLSQGPGSDTTNVATFTLAKTATGLQTKASFAILLVVTAVNPLHPGTGRASLAASGTSNGLPSYSPVVTFAVGPVSAATSSVVATPPVAQVGTTSTVTVTVLDANTNPIAGALVTLTANAGAVVTGTATAPGASLTDTAGQAVFEVTDASVAEVTLTATVTHVTLAGSVRFAHGTYLQAVGVSPTSVPAGGASTYTVTLVTSATGALGATSTISIVGPTGTAWPATTASYVVTGQTPTSVTGAGTAAHPLVLTLGRAVAGDGATVTLAATHVVNPLTPSTGDQLTVATSADSTPTPSNPYSVVAVPVTGYDMVGHDGGVFVFNAPGTSGGYYGSLPEMGVTPVSPIVGMVPTATDGGYFLVGGDGGVFAFGDAPFLGSSDQINPALPPGGPNSFQPSAPMVGIVATGTDKGYFLVGRDGGVFAFGTAPFLGSLPSKGISVDNVIGIAATPSGSGYWVIQATGAVTAFGNAKTLGAATGLGSPVAAIAGTPTGGGYWVVAQDGAVKAFGNATGFGTLPALHVTPNLPVVGVVPIDGTGGYWLIGATGGIYAFGNAAFLGSLPAINRAVTDIAGAVPN